MQLISHQILQKFVLLHTRTVACIEYCRICAQYSRRLRKRLPALSVQVEFHEVKTADQHIRMKPLHNIQDALVGASADQHPPCSVVDQQILLMPKIIRHKVRVIFRRQAGAVGRIRDNG